jgi:hypothetical protein
MLNGSACSASLDWSLKQKKRQVESYPLSARMIIGRNMAITTTQVHVRLLEAMWTSKSNLSMYAQKTATAAAVPSSKTWTGRLKNHRGARLARVPSLRGKIFNTASASANLVSPGLNIRFLIGYALRGA